MPTFNTDNDHDVQILMRLKPMPGLMEYRPRREEYGSAEAIAAGLEPVENSPDVLLQPDQYRDAVKLAHEQQTMPLYHCYKWRPAGFKYNQDGIGYCWTWSGTGCMMTTRAAENRPLVKLAPVSMGYLVGWKDEGNYLESYIRGAREQGVCPSPDGDINSLNRSSAYWENVGERGKYRLDKVWDTRANAMEQHCVSILCYGRSLYIAYSWWGHAVELVAVRYNGSTMEWVISNSHNEADVITLTGSRAIPSEAYAFVSTVFTD
jgi:hypothetical protein